MRAVASLGETVWTQWDEVRHGGGHRDRLSFSIQPRYWARRFEPSSRGRFWPSGSNRSGLFCGVAVFVGISVVVQLAFWTGKAGQSQLLGPLLVAVVARELGPLLTNIVVIVRSSSAMATELGVLKINGEVRALEAQGNDPFLHLVMPRVLGVAVSTFCLTIVFILVALASGYFFGAWLGTGSRDVWFFTNTVLNALHPRTWSASSPRASCPLCLPAPPVALAGWAWVNRSRTSRTPRSGR